MMIATVFFAGCNEESKDNGSGQNKDNGSKDGSSDKNSDQTTSDLISAKDAWQEVKNAVETWDPDFKLARVHHYGTNQWDINAKEISWEFYVESGDGDKSTDFTYSTEEGLTKSTDTGFSTGRKTFEIINWTIDSTEAANIALDIVKDDIYPDYEGGFTAELYANENNTPYWEVVYNNRRKDGNYYLNKPLQTGAIEINAKTGEIIKIDNYEE